MVPLGDRASRIVAASERDRFLQERQILASLSHPNIARMLDAGHLENDQPFLAMEYVDGEPIDVFARACRTPTAPWTWPVSRDC